jgi:CheY-like chemotaxis protein
MPTEPVYLHADATRLEQVLNNLIANACKYSGEGTRILLSAELGPAAGSSSSAELTALALRGKKKRTELKRGEVIIRVRDNGAGIAPELLPRIFDLFVQSSRTLDRANSGLGIGLTLVQRLVRLHGGSVEAHSEGLGRGAEFIVRLPVIRKRPARAAPPPSAGRETPRRILIVDDNTDSALSLARLQSRRGHRTRTAFTGPDAVTVAAEFLPEVVLLDIGLPGMDGFEVAQRMRAMPELSGAFIVAMSGYGSDEYRFRAKEAGFNEYLIKPLDLDLLRGWLRSRP